MDRNFDRKACLCQGVPTLRQSYHDDYACPNGRVVVSDDDGMTFNMRVPVVMCTWVHMIVSCRVRH
jgi:hypothetical protein